MRILFACLSGTGHFLPLIPLARSAEAAGHEVVVASGSRIAGTVRAAGLPFEEAGPPSIESVAATIPELRTLQGRAHADGIWGRVFSGPLASGLAEGILAIAGRWSPDVIVREDTALGGWIAADVLGLPMTTVQITAWRPRLRPLASANVGRVRASYGLPPDPALARADRDLLLVARPATLIPPDAPLPPTARPMRPIAADDRDGQPIPSWLANGYQTGRPRVAVTLGTVNSGRTDILRPVVDGVADRGGEVVVALGAPPETLGHLAPGVRVEEYVPMSALLPRSDVVVCHGGSGTMLAALAAGIPLVIIPLAADQPDNADVCVSAGVAKAIAPEELTPAAVRAAVDEVLGDGKYRERANAVAAEIAAMPSPETCIEQVVALVATPRPTA